MHETGAPVQTQLKQIREVEQNSRWEMTLARKTILIVDPDPIACNKLEDLFASQGWGVKARHDAHGTLKYLEDHRPDLIVLEPELPDEHGTQLIAYLRNHPRWGPLPVFVVTEERQTQNRLNALRLGVLDYLLKPYDGDELVFRIRQHLSSSCLTGEKLLSESPTSEEKLLASVAAGELRELTPVVERKSRYGYAIPVAAQILQPGEVGQELDILDDLASAGKLLRTFHDVVHLCPTCRHHDLNFREVCPACKSSNIRLEKLFKHVTCSHLAPKFEFIERNGRCPKCSQKVLDGHLAQAGLRFVCRQCRATFKAPIVICRCLNCGEQHDVDDLERRMIWSYRDVPSAAEIDVKARAPELQPSVLEPLLGKSVAQMLSSGDILPALEQELHNAEVGGSSLAVVQLNLEGLGKTAQRFGLSKLTRLLTTGAQKVHRVLRADDRMGYYGPAGFLIILPHSDLSDAKTLAERVLTYLRQVLPGVYVSVRLAGYPQDGRTVGEILEMLEVGIETLGQTAVDFYHEEHSAPRLSVALVV